MKRPFFIFLLCAFPFLHAAQAKNNSAPASDTLPDIIKARTVLQTDPVLAQHMLDTVMLRQSAPSYQIDWVQYMVYEKQRKLKLAEKSAIQAFESDSIQQNIQYYMNMAENLSKLYIYMGDYGKAIEYAGKQLDKIKAEDLPEYTKRNPLWILAQSYMALGNKEQGYKLAEEALSIYKTLADTCKTLSQPTARRLYDLSQCYTSLTLWHCKDGNYARAYETAAEQWKTVQKLALIPGKYVPQIIVKGQESHCTGNLAYICTQLGRRKEAEEWFSLLKKNPDFNTLEGRQLAIRYYAGINNQAGIIEFALQNREIYKSQDSIHPGNRDACLQLAEAYTALGKYLPAMQYMRTALSITDSIHTRLARDNAMEMAVLYDTREKEFKIENQAKLLRSNRIILAASTAALALLLIVLSMILRNTAVTRRRNRAMYGQIREQLKYKEQAQEKIARLENLCTAMHASVRTGNYNETLTEEDKLFNALQELIYKEQLFREPDLTRDYIVKRLFTNKNKLIAVLQSRTGMSFTAYINGIRLEKALQCLSDDKPHMETIAAECGFGSYRSMLRVFKAKYGMSPGEYMRQYK